ncbi:MAG: DUF222 domain-containing protein [Acidimicrobiia bacterium]|nr:DUF222 domain-containing protein [Acidimicrobiia bacterium]
MSQPAPASATGAAHAELLAAAQEAAAQVTAWQAQLVEATRALMATQCNDPWRAYLAWALGMTSPEAGGLTELAERLEELPLTREMMARGERSMRVVLAIARRATPDTEAVILSTTEAFTGNQLDRALKAYARVIRPSERDLHPGDDLPDDDPDPSSARWSWRGGRFRLTADLDAIDGAALEGWLDAERTRVSDDAPEVPRERTNAEALMSLGERAVGNRANDVGFMPEVAAVNVVVHARETDDGLVIDQAFIPGAGTVPSWWLPMLAEQGTVTTTVMINGLPQFATSPTRFATADQRRSMLARDGGCVYPSCSATARLIAHHIRHYDEGGPTELANMVLLCKRHHRLVHRNNLRITPDPEAPPGTFRWRVLDELGRPVVPHMTGTPRRYLAAGPPRRGDHDTLTFWALDVTVTNWLVAHERSRAAA